MGIIGGLLYPNVRIQKKRVDERSPCGLVQIVLEVFGRSAMIVMRDRRSWPYVVDGHMTAMPEHVASVKFRAWEMTVWKPGKAEQ